MRNESLVQEVVALVAFVRECAKTVHGTAKPSKEEMLEILEDIITHSDSLMSSILASPLTGRMNVNPAIELTEAECQASLAAALGV